MVKKKVSYDESNPRDAQLLSLLENAGHKQGELCKSALLFVSRLYNLNDMDPVSVKRFVDFLKSASCSGNALSVPQMTVSVSPVNAIDSEKTSAFELNNAKPEPVTPSLNKNDDNLADSKVSIDEVISSDDEFAIDPEQEANMMRVLSAFGV